MRFTNITIKLFAFFLGVYTLTSCLEGDDMNMPPDGSTPFIMMTNNPEGGTILNSGIRYFSNQALLLDPTIDNDTMVFAVALEGVASFNKDVNVTLSIPPDALDDYFDVDKIPYEMMPADGYTMLSTTGVIPKGKSFAEFKVVFHPSKIDLTKNYMLPITATNDANIVTSSNYGYVYYHSIGNPLAGPYELSYRRYNSADSVGALAGTLESTAIFAPNDGTTLQVLGGYATTVGINAPYVLTFKETNGQFSDFKLSMDPALTGGLTDNGIEITEGPLIVKAVVTPNYRYFKFMYKVFNGEAYRTLIDEYTWEK